MMTIIRKKTGEAVAWDVPADSLDTVLWAMPSGVYGIEDSEGNEINTAVVKCGRVAYAK